MSLQDDKIAINYAGSTFNVSVSIEEGSNNWVVGLHGLQSTKNLYTDFFNQAGIRNYSKLAISFIGFGETDKPNDFSYDLADQAKIIKLVLNQLHIRNFHLIGHSLGGMVGTLLLESLANQIISFANLEGNLTFADCGTSKEVIKMELSEFENNGYKQLKETVEQSDEPSSAARSEWLKTIPSAAFYKTSKSIVEWSESEKLLGMFNNSNVRRMFMYGSSNSSKAQVVDSGVQKVPIDNAGHFMLLDNSHAAFAALEAFVKAK